MSNASVVETAAAETTESSRFAAAAASAKATAAGIVASPITQEFGKAVALGAGVTLGYIAVAAVYNAVAN